MLNHETEPFYSRAMARRKIMPIRAPTAVSLPDNLRIPSSTPSLVKTLSKLSRPTLLNLALEWLDDGNVSSFPPLLNEKFGADLDETNPYPAASTVEEVRDVYTNFQERKGAKREVIDRMLLCDWKEGIALRQLAMVDMRDLDDHPSRLRWTALQLTRIGQQDQDEASLPRMSASTFLTNLQHQISPLVKAHYHLSRSSSLMTFLRIFMTDSPYQYPRESPQLFTDSSKIVYVAFPDSSPFIYTSFASSKKATVGGTRDLRHIITEAIPKALSRPHERYSLEPTALSAKDLSALLALRGSGRSNNANGAFSIFADAVVEPGPLDPRPSHTVSSEELHKGREGEITEKVDMTPPPPAKKRKQTIHSRFGTVGTLSSVPLDRLHVKMLDPPSTTTSIGSGFPMLSLTFAGSDVISGIRKLAELGIVDPERMPSWMTGEEGVSVASVRRGRRVLQDGG